MKKIILIAVAAAFAVAGYGQDGKNYIGGGLTFGTDIETVGITVKYGYGITNRLYVEPNFNYFIKNNVNMYDINLDFQYRFYVVDKLSIYPIVGLSFAHYKYKFKLPDPINGNDLDAVIKTNKMGANFGAGAAYDITNRLFVNIDLKYRAMQHIGQGAFHFGVGYRF